MGHTARGALAGACLGLLLAQAAPVLCARLPVRDYTTADGLAHDRVEGVFQDSRGFLWFGTAEGLSRFDGYRFTTFGAESGLPPGSVKAVFEAAGEYWVATEGGVCAFRPPLSRCEARAIDAPGGHVHALARDTRGRLWAGTDVGVFRADSSDAPFQRVTTLPAPEGALPRRILAVTAGLDGSLWFGGQGGLWRVLPDDRILHYDRDWTDGDIVFTVLADGDRTWVGHLGGLSALSTGLVASEGDRPVLRAAPTGCERRLSTLRPGDNCLVHDSRGPAGQVLALARSADGTIWAGTRNYGLLEITSGTLRRHGTESGLASNAVRSLAEDRDGNLWIGTEGRGVVKLARRGLVSWGHDDGLRNTRILSVFGDRAGEPHLLNGAGIVRRFENGAWAASAEPLRNGVRGPFGFGSRMVMQDRAGSWWLGTGWALFRLDGITRVADLHHRRPSARFTADADGGPAPAAPLLEDEGGVWAGSLVAGKPCLLRWERRTDTARTVPLPADLPAAARVAALAADRTGAVWIGMTEGGLLRLQKGRAERVAAPNRASLSAVRAFHLDGAGRLWIAGDAAGLGRIDHPEAVVPESRWWGRSEGLASDSVYCVTEDRLGRVHVGTALGVTRLDDDGGHMRHYGIADGLAASEVRSAFADRHGRLWFGTMDGVSSLSPVPEPPSAPPAVSIAGLRVAGVARPLSFLGEPEVTGLDLPAGHGHVEIEYASVALGLGERLRYRYRLEGADDEWSVPTERRMVSYAHLAPGTYRFAVEAINADGVVSARPATVELRVLPALWQRAWFLAAAAAVIALAAYAGFRYRLGMLLEVERVRLRVAADLHDDIGSNLSKIAILSEVAHRQEAPARERSLTQIADMARQLVDSMSDIVWAVNPSRDSLRDLSQRMRGFATELFSAMDVALKLDGPADAPPVPLKADVRRQVFLIFKEAVTNAAAHSRCRRVEATLRVERGRLELRVADDGTGFDPAGVSDGHGLQSLRERARAIDGTLDVRSAPGQGTVVSLDAPLSGRRPRRHYLTM